MSGNDNERCAAPDHRLIQIARISQIGINNIAARSAAFRTCIRKSESGRRVFRLVERSRLSEGEAIYTVVIDGIRD